MVLSEHFLAENSCLLRLQTRLMREVRENRNSKAQSRGLRCPVTPGAMLSRATGPGRVSQAELVRGEGSFGFYESASTVCIHEARSASAYSNNMGLLPHGLMMESSALDDRRRWGPLRIDPWIKSD